MLSKPSRPGKFITVEGIDGAGKSSHLTAICSWITDQGIPCTQTREPGGTPLGESVRALVLHQTMQPLTELLLVFAARAEHVQTVIAPALARGDWVVSDRFTDATRAYQGAGRGLDSAQIETLAHMVHTNCEPDLTLIFDLSPSQAAVRVKDRGVADRFEGEAREFADRVRAGYLDTAKRFPERCVLIDGSAQLAQVRVQVLKALAYLQTNADT